MLHRAVVILLSLLTAACSAADDAALNQKHRDSVQPFLKSYCVSCHSGDKVKGDFDITSYLSPEKIAANYALWEMLLDKVKSNEMPPPKAKLQPTENERREFIAWIQDLRRHGAKRNAGDPGPVFARRLNNTEYDYTIRDLTGIDIKPAREFPIDPANQAGFDNSSESLAMSPALVKKYIEAARLVADHLVLKPDGIAFAPHRVVTETDCDKYCVNRILAFYKKQQTDYADYFLAAWQFKHRAAVGKANAALDAFATDAGLSKKYLNTIWNLLSDKPEESGPNAALQAWWRDIPAPDAKNAKAVRMECEHMRDFVVALRQQLVPEVKNLTVQGMINSAQCLVLWKDRQFAANRRRYGGGALKLKEFAVAADSPAEKAMAAPADADRAKEHEKTFERFCDVFPDTFVVTHRARVFMDDEKEKNNVSYRPLSAGFHSQMGYFRDDKPLYDLLLDADQQRELDLYWQELDFIANVPQRQYSGFLWFERTDSRFLRDAEFDFARAEDKDAITPAKMSKLEKLYRAKAVRNGAKPMALEAIGDYFKEMSDRARWVERTRLAAEPGHVKALQDLAERAYRRPLSPSERDDVAAFYRSLRDKDALSHDDAMRDTLVGILMSPHFCYRLDLPRAAAPAPGSAAILAASPLSDYALASRLSYFLWSAMPDKELLDRAAAGELRRPEVLAAQARRMLQDDRVRGLAVQFGGNWLDFRRFEEYNSVDRGRFPVFTNELRQAMFDEPIRFLTDALRRDSSIFELLYANHTFVNQVLARHYGMPDVSAGSNKWVRVDDASKYGRGGLLPMAVFLTKNAPGLRTSPVKRGYWVVRRVLGERIPPPPPNVPELPSDEAKLGEMTLRDALAHHRDNPSCSGCHARFDALGLVFEGYGPVGERREKDLGGRLVDTKANFPNGGEGAGLDGLRAYLRDKRQDEFVENICRELLAYGLGRTLQLSDDDTINEMKRKLATNGNRIGVLIEAVVTSRQFVSKRN